MTKFTQINIDRDTKRKIDILAPVLGDKIFELVARWTESAWREALAAGQVTEAALDGPHNGNGRKRES